MSLPGNDPTFLAWLITLAFICAGALLIRASAGRQIPLLVLGGLVLMVGLNKQLDLQNHLELLVRHSVDTQVLRESRWGIRLGLALLGGGLITVSIILLVRHGHRWFPEDRARWLLGFGMIWFLIFAGVRNAVMQRIYGVWMTDDVGQMDQRLLSSRASHYIFGLWELSAAVALLAGALVIRAKRRESEPILSSSSAD